MVEKYTDILARGWDEIPEPKTLPANTSWRLKGRNAAWVPPKGDVSGRVVFFYFPTEPMDDVTDAQLQALGKGYDFSNNDITKTFWIERTKDWDAVRKHLTKHGIALHDRASGGIQRSLKDFRGAEIVAVLDVRNYTTSDGEEREENIPTSFVPVEG